MEETVLFLRPTLMWKDITKELNSNKYYYRLYRGSKGKDLQLEGRMSFGIHFAMEYLTEQTQLQMGEIEEPTITAKGKNVIVIMGILVQVCGNCAKR